MCKVCRIAVVLVFALTILPSPSSAQVAPNKMKLLTQDKGWALFHNRLYWTNDFGQHWRDITPPSNEGIADVFFLDTFTGWALLRQYHPGGPYGDWRFAIASTTDSGASWSITAVSIPGWNPKAYTLGGSGTLDFADATHGWMDLSLQSSSATDWGALFTTDDGGRHWDWAPTARSAPGVFGSLLLLSPRFGWLAGGPGYSGLYVTRDGCLSWQRVQPTPPRRVGVLVTDEQPAPEQLPKGEIGVRALYQLPAFLDSEHGFLPVTYFDYRGRAVPIKLVIYTTNDGGRTWSPTKVVAAKDEGTAGLPIPVNVTDRTALMPAQSLPGKAAVTSVPLLASSGDTGTVTPSLRGARRLSFVDPSHGWAFTGWIYATTDGGATWTDITPKPKRPGPQSFQIPGDRGGWAVAAPPLYLAGRGKLCLQLSNRRAYSGQRPECRSQLYVHLVHDLSLRN